MSVETDELEWRLLFAMVVAGKSEKFARAALGRFMGDPAGDWSPLTYVEYLVKRGELLERLRHARTGNYTKLEQGFREAAAADLDLKTVTPEQLEKIHGIGPKTSRFFVIWTRPNESHAALDTHVLKWLRYLGHEAPMSTPNGAEYDRLQAIVLQEAADRGMTARELDAQVWEWCRNKGHVNGAWPPNLQRVLP